MYFKRLLDPGDVGRIVELLEEASALEFSRALLKSHCERALDALSRAPVSSAGRGTLERLLQEMADEA